mgnify:CR=1 FL=1
MRSRMAAHQADIDEAQAKLDAALRARRVEALKVPGEEPAPEGSKPKPGNIAKQTEPMTWEDYNALTPLRRSAVDYNTSLTRAVRRDRQMQDEYSPGDQQREAYDKTVARLFGEDGGSDWYAPETVALLQQIIDQLPMNIFCRDKHGRYLFANKAFAREAGLQQPSDLVGKTDAEMPWGDQFREEDGRLLAEGKPLLHQQWHCHSGANTNWMEIHKVPLYDEQGNPLALFAMVSAIDQRKELEQTFRQQIGRAHV